METIHAIFEGGVFRPTEPVLLAEKSNVVLNVQSVEGVPSDDDMEDNYEILDRRHKTGIKDFAGGAGIVDQISFVVMRRLSIARAFTNDEHFRAAGFETLF